MKFHLIGVGGAGMSVVAELLLAEGHEVSGSDRTQSANLARLQAAGVQTFVGHQTEQVPADAVVVISSAIKPENPELQIAQARGQQILHRSQALVLAAGERDFVAVAGAHGKTSTTGMLAMAFEDLGWQPSWAIGGSLAGGRSGGHLGAGSVLVAEADESDGSFLNYRPRVAIVTSVEPDHLDHYGTAAAFAEAFLEFAQRLVPGGLLVCNADHPGSAQLAQQCRALGIRVHTYGVADAPSDGAAAHAQLTLPTAIGEAAKISFAGQQYSLQLTVPGDHNYSNASAAWLAGVELGASGTAMARALASYHGMQRRFELRGKAADISVVDDYAHHPTEVAVTLKTARALAPQVRVLFQPHLYSRTKNFAAEFAHALAAADSVIVTSVYPAREDPSAGVEGDAITAYLPGAEFIADPTVAAQQIANTAQAGDLIITMGAGDITGYASVVLAELKKREAQ
ncbi:MAG: UDP-N-acetylmuramate--L-alanine ligase [Trueperella sp.]|nr:UDP-N-acetylmuramate--L-alanine ligase [Trueperella sp.]